MDARHVLGPFFFCKSNSRTISCYLILKTMLVAQCFWVFNRAYLLVYQMFWPFYICPYFALEHGFLAVISLFVNDLLHTHDHLDELGYSLSVVLICCKVLVPFLFLLSFFVDSS